MSLIFSLCSNSSADPIKGNQQGTSISLPSFQGEKTPSSRTCHWMSPKFHEFAGKTALVYQKHSRVLEKTSENKYDSQPSSPVSKAGKLRTHTQTWMCSLSLVETLRFTCCGFQLPNTSHTWRDKRFSTAGTGS